MLPELIPVFNADEIIEPVHVIGKGHEEAPYGGKANRLDEGECSEEG